MQQSKRMSIDTVMLRNRMEISQKHEKFEERLTQFEEKVVHISDLKTLKFHVNEKKVGSVLNRFREPILRMDSARKRFHKINDRFC